MNLQPENAADCFKRLLNESKSQKFHNSLERVKKACDTIEGMKGLLNYSRVARYTETHFSSPKRQSIMNSKKLRLYIDLRKEEYEETAVRSPDKTGNTKKLLYSKDIDLKTKVFIDHILARNAFLEKSQRYVQQHFLRETKKHPIDLSKSIEAGAQEDLSMEIVKEHGTENTKGLSRKARKAIQKLLSLTENPNCPLELQSVNGEQVLVLETPLTSETILFGDELEELQILVQG